MIKIVVKKKLTCSQVKQYYERHFNGILPEVIEEAIAQHFAECKECDEDYIKWALGRLRKKFNKKKK